MPESKNAARVVGTCEAPPAPALSFRVLAFALLGLVVNAHGAWRGRRDWVLRYDGSFTRTPMQRTQRQGEPGLTVTLGLGAVHGCASAAACLLVLAACFTAKRWLSVPALLLTASDLLADVSDAVVATVLLLSYSGLAPALVYAFVATLVIALELFLWLGVLWWYEQGLAVHVKQLERRLAGRQPPSTASSVSSITTFTDL
ncbi:uncharacterized protein LOC117646298 [Thrips palmi]|uniref:Uncharacterized protein LOC117646298 n=1 Tax=Thrips palmi TaxID=161013 RepID=A0A6P8YZF4_THRPL|nr:uncharacterized protein LOC117646298 [Thrips palmi]